MTKNSKIKEEKIPCPDCGKMLSKGWMPKHIRICKNFDKCLI